MGDKMSVTHGLLLLLSQLSNSLSVINDIMMWDMGLLIWYSARDLEQVLDPQLLCDLDFQSYCTWC